jgi:hypothetical protein
MEPTTKVITRPTTKLPPSLVNSAVLHRRLDFNPDKHICYGGMPQIHHGGYWERDVWYLARCRISALPAVHR